MREGAKDYTMLNGESHKAERTIEPQEGHIKAEENKVQERYTEPQERYTELQENRVQVRYIEEERYLEQARYTKPQERYTEPAERYTELGERCTSTQENRIQDRYVETHENKEYTGSSRRLANMMQTRKVDALFHALQASSPPPAMESFCRPSLSSPQQLPPHLQISIGHPLALPPTPVLPEWQQTIIALLLALHHPDLHTRAPIAHSMNHKHQQTVLSQHWAHMFTGKVMKRRKRSLLTILIRHIKVLPLAPH